MNPEPSLESAARSFSSDRLRLARQASGLRKNELAREIGLTPASITQYEQGQTRPRPRVVAALALALNRPVGYFAKDDRPLHAADPSTAFFRSLRATRQHEREQAAARAELVWEIAEFLERYVYLPTPAFPDIAIPERSSRQTIEDAATSLRGAWGLGDGPIANVVRTLEQHGVVVARLGSVSPSIDAFSQWIGGRPLIVLWAGKADAGRSRFDAAHELAHLALYHDPDPGNKALEDQAQAFAAAFLMPEHSIVDALPRQAPRGDGWLDLFQLKVRFGVSLQALLYRARTLGVLSHDAYRRAMIQLSERGWRTKEPSDLGPPEQPILLRQAVELLTDDRGLGLAEIARDLRTPQRLITEAVVGSSALAT